MKQLRSIGVGSVFRVSLVLGAVAGLLAGFVLMIVDFTDPNHGYVEGIATFLLAPVIYGLLGALVNAFMAWVYNIVAARMGGIDVSFDE
ncbi:MAG TPA: hypothetical protein VMU17_02985 [Elusimicrobiota bacterium]|nr:hypothetical protein [Elusimicrobiota bacterium]